MPERAVWKARPVFVTSTFRDMHAERDHLHAFVFPELQERLRERFHHLEPIDLRWGVETVSAGEQEAKELLVLKVCLAEIERSRPFLVALLGDRYGWIPPPERMEAAAREAGFEADLTGRSVTALEIRFGVLDAADQARRSRFYFREPLPYDRMDAETAAVFSDLHDPRPGAREAHERLEALKARIEARLPDRVRRYAAGWDEESGRVVGLEAWGRQVVENLWEDLEAETREALRARPATWQEQEAEVLEQFVETQCRDFVGRGAVLERLRARAASPAEEDGLRGACVTGPAGSGKNSLFARLVRDLRETEVLVLAHAAGVSPRASRVDSLLRRWIGDLAAAAGVDDPSEDVNDREELEQVFRQLLVRVSRDRRVILVVDALDQLERTPSGRHATWVPRGLPPNVRFFATAIPGSESRALADRPELEEVELPALDASEAGAIADAVCRRYHKTLSSEVRRTLTERRRPDGEPAAGNPLWLTLALDELLLLDEDDFARAERDQAGTPEERLHALLLDTAASLPPDVESLYGHVLGRTERAYGAALARAFADLLAVSRGGWRESDLREVLPAVTGEAWDPLRFAALRRGFRGQVVQRGASAQWDFVHAQAREAVRRRNLGDPQGVRRLHGRIADHLEGLDRADPLRETELMVHLLGTEDRERAAEHHGGELTPREEDGATAALAAHLLADPEQDPAGARFGAARALLEAETAPEVTAGVARRFVFDLNDALEQEARLALRLAVVLSARTALERLASQDPGHAGWQRDLSVSHNKVGDVLVAQGNLAEALEAYRASLVIRERLASQDPGHAGWQRDLSVSHNKVGDVLVAQGNLAEALEAYRASLVIAERLASQDPGHAGWQRDLASAHCFVGMVLQDQGDLEGALAEYRAYRDAMERLASQDPGHAGWQRDLSVSHNKVGDVLVAQGNLAEALEAYRASLVIRERLASQDPGHAGWQRDLWVSCWKIADVLEQDQDARAIGWWRRAHEVLSGLRRSEAFVSPSDLENLRWLETKLRSI